MEYMFMFSLISFQNGQKSTSPNQSIYLTKSESFKAVKRHFTSWFAAHGYPKFIKTDNGSPYQSAAFKLFLDDQE